MGPTPIVRQTRTDGGDVAPAISLISISKSFAGPDGKRLEVLTNINLTVAEHAIVGLLGAQTRALMHQELLRIHQLKRITAVFVTHDVEEAAVLADRVAVMSPRPGTIRAVVDITLPRPRDPTQSEVAHYIQRLRALI